MLCVLWLPKSGFGHACMCYGVLYDGDRVGRNCTSLRVTAISRGVGLKVMLVWGGEQFPVRFITALYGA
jgi:hypothetical protein